MRRGLPGCCLAVLLACLAACQERASDGVLRMGLASAPVNLDPRLATDAASSRVNGLLYRRLVEFDDAYRAVPGLATWHREDPSRYRFQLTEAAAELRFSHGKRLDSGDVLATLESLLDAATGSPFRAPLQIIQRMRTLDERQLEFILARPDPLFPALLAIDIMPADLLAKRHPFSRQPVGCGPFTLSAWPAPGTLHLRRQRDGLMLELHEVRDPGVRVMKLLRGEIDLLQNDLPPELFAFLRQRQGIEVQRRPGANFTYMGMNLEDPHLRQATVRRAIAHGIDREAIIHYVLSGAALPAAALLPPQHWAGAENLPQYRYDPALARQLLARAGYSADKPLTLEYKTSTDPFRVRLATIVQAQLKRVGVQVKVRSLDWGTFFGDIKSGRFQLYSLTWVGIKTPDHFRYVFHSGSLPPDGANRGRYRSAAADHLIETAEAAQSREQQAHFYAELQHLLLQDLPYIPLWYEDQIMAARVGVRGYELAADGNYDRLAEAWRDIGADSP
jgi:peptide/nickel transport system substrate-binding protein